MKKQTIVEKEQADIESQKEQDDKIVKRRAKKNNNSIYYKDWTLRKLKSEAESLHDCIYGQASCYGTSDLRMYDGILSELDRRGVDINTKLSFN